MSRGIYITGTDTGVGKTRVACALVHALRGRGLRVAAMKPVASGAEQVAGEWRNGDVEALLAACAPGMARELLNPYCLPDPTAPEIAARRAGVAVQLAPMLQAHAALAAAHDVVVVEGVGGWESPLAEQLLQADLCRALSLPVLTVVGLRLGCINHARLTLRAIAADGLDCIGWCGSAVDPALAFAGDTVAILQRDLPVPLLGLLPHAPATSAEAEGPHLAAAARVVGERAGTGAP